LTREEALCLLRGAVKGNVIYGSVASAEGQMTLDLLERFAKEWGIDALCIETQPINKG
jgi:hypothetical protein